MPNKASVININKEVVETCLQTFIEKGISETRSHDLRKVLNLQSVGMHYNFSSIDGAVVACVEEAATILNVAL